MHKGKLIVLSGPSGVGKGSIRQNMKFKNYEYSISSTTRLPREHEINGQDYYFISKEEFENKIKNGEMLEYATFIDNYYGTDKNKVLSLLEQGKNVLLEIECDGAMQVINKIPEAISIFILPPSMEALEKRLYNRNTESRTIIKKRLAKAQEELQYKNNYKYNIVNDDLKQASAALDQILFQECGNNE